MGRLHFVGREIHANPQTSYLATRKMKKTGQQVKMRMIPRPFLKAPLLYLYQTLHYHGLAKIHYDPKNPRNYRVIATRRMKLIPRSHEEILFHEPFTWHLVLILSISLHGSNVNVVSAVNDIQLSQDTGHVADLVHVLLHLSLEFLLETVIESKRVISVSSESHLSHHFL